MADPKKTEDEKILDLIQAHTELRPYSQQFEPPIGNTSLGFFMDAGGWTGKGENPEAVEQFKDLYKDLHRNMPNPYLPKWASEVLNNPLRATDTATYQEALAASRRNPSMGRRNLAEDNPYFTEIYRSQGAEPLLEDGYAYRKVVGPGGEEYVVNLGQLPGTLRAPGQRGVFDETGETWPVKPAGSLGRPDAASKKAKLQKIYSEASPEQRAQMDEYEQKMRSMYPDPPEHLR